MEMGAEACLETRGGVRGGMIIIIESSEFTREREEPRIRALQYSHSYEADPDAISHL